MRRILVGLVVFFTLITLTPAGAAWAGEPVRFMLDWSPNPDHVPIYAAKQAGFFKKAGIDLEIMVPGDPHDPLKLVAAGKVDLAVSYQPSVIMARDEGLPAASIAALVQHPLSCIMYLQESGFTELSDLKGKKIGYSVEPLYRVLFEAAAEQAGLTPDDYETIHVGFNLSSPLLTGQVDAVIGAFRNYETIQVQLAGKEPGVFPLEENGIPDYYELVIIAQPKWAADNAETVAGFLTALEAGIDLTLERPQKALKAFFQANPDLDDELNRLAFAATLPFFAGSPEQTAKRWRAMQDFMHQRGLIKEKSPLSDLMLVKGK